jgi:hypothetical protein
MLNTRPTDYQLAKIQTVIFSVLKVHKAISTERKARMKAKNDANLLSNKCK